MNEVDIIRGARELLSDPKRWHKGSLVSPDGTAVCLLGALERSLHGASLINFGARDRAEELLVSHLPSRYDSQGDEKLRPAALFNDDPATIHQDILNLFDKCLADLGALA